MPVAQYFGIEKPRRPERLLALVSSALLLMVLLLSLGALLALGEFAWPSPRGDYFVYIAALCLLGAVCAPAPRLSAPLLALAAIDLGLGMGSLVLQGRGVQSMLLPVYYPATGFQWHPLLQATPIRSLAGGFPGVKITHSRESTRGRDYTAAELRAKTVVAVFGGSTTYDIGVSDGQTWAEQLERRLGPDVYAVINHGVLGYSTVEHVVQTAFYQDKFGKQPRCTVFYVGWNDIRNSHIPRLDPGYADYHLLTQVDSLKTRRIGADFVTPSPLVTLLVRGFALASDTVRPAPALPVEYHIDPDPHLEALFVRNVRTISAINRERSVRTLWVGQLVNVAAMATVDGAGWTPMIRSRDLWRVLQHLNRRLRETAAELGDPFVDVPADAFDSADFVDSGHFSAAGAAKFGKFLAEPVRSGCR